MRRPDGRFAWTLAAHIVRQGGEGAPQALETADQIAAGVDAMSRMISDLLDFTGAGLGGGMRVDRAPMDLTDVCREVVCETRAGHPACTVVCESLDADGDTAGASIRGDWDHARLRQLVSNLLGNAVQHGADACRVDLTLDGRDPDAVVLAVHNGGPPIPREAIATIFDPLVRVPSADLNRQRRPGSIGLGLFIVRQVAAAHGGTVEVTSSPDAGTTFTVRLPRHPR